MKWTQEQQKIINSTGNIKINAVAGSGKTTTVIEYARSRSAESKILYLAFNKSVKLEAAKKFQKAGLQNVQVETAHSLAYKYIIYNSNYRIRAQGYKTSEIAELLHLQGNGEKHNEYIIANHINKFITYFCNSDKLKVQDLNYLDTISDSNAKKFVTTFYQYILSKTRLLLSKMDKGEIEITHDFYLKKFQILNPKLPFDFILFDEGQDASPAMLDVFLKQNATKVIVGDTNQQIYGWRFAVNSLEKANFETHYLSASFRFSQDIADLAKQIFKYKNYINNEEAILITGKGEVGEIKSKAIIARTNLGLLLKAIEYVTENKKVKYIYFEGNINSYTYADEGASLYDVLNLQNENRHLIKDKLIKAMKNLKELEDYIGKTEDMQLGMMVEIVKEYGNKIPNIIKTIKNKHVEGDEKEKAEMIFSTVHRCKGMEYDSVRLVEDFISEEKLEKIKKDKKPEEINFTKLNEEINLLYVAVTRAKSKLYIPESLMPLNFPESSQIHVIKDIPKEDKKAEKTYSVDLIREKHKGAYQPWTPDLDQELSEMFSEGISGSDLARHFGRTKSAISSRLKKLDMDNF